MHLVRGQNEDLSSADLPKFHRSESTPGGGGVKSRIIVMLRLHELHRASVNTDVCGPKSWIKKHCSLIEGTQDLEIYIPKLLPKQQ